MYCQIDFGLKVYTQNDTIPENEYIGLFEETDQDLYKSI